MNFLKKSELKDKIYFKFLLYFIYKILLEVIYVWGVGKYFSGFKSSITVLEYLLYSFIYFIMVYVMVHLDKIKKNSALMISLFNWFYFIPSLILIGFTIKNYIYLLLLLVFFFELNINFIFKKESQGKRNNNKKRKQYLHILFFYYYFNNRIIYMCTI